MTMTNTGRHLGATDLAVPVIGLKTAMPSIKVLPQSASARVGYDQVQASFGDGAPAPSRSSYPTTTQTPPQPC
jgi:hypothetical protein